MPGDTAIETTRSELAAVLVRDGYRVALARCGTDAELARVKAVVQYLLALVEKDTATLEVSGRIGNSSNFKTTVSAVSKTTGL